MIANTGGREAGTREDATEMEGFAKIAVKGTAYYDMERAHRV